MTQTLDLRKKPESESKPAPKAPALETVQSSATPSQAASEPAPTEISWESILDTAPAKTTAWYLFLALAIGAGALVWFRHDFLFSLVLVLAGIVVVLRSYTIPQKTRIIVNGSGITVGPETYYYHELKSFWLDYRPPYVRELSLEFKRAYRPMIRLPIEAGNPLEIRTIMVPYIPEKEHELSFLDQLSRRIGF
ncbi:MAG TPA: hypothetical protein VG941_01355 [Candidatus Paceibacterota bacterium]|nr:hypothetical protein [Candidatus Paceibacterota bacterium]